MRLQDIVSQRELDAVEQMIDAHLDVELAKQALWNAQERLRDKIKALSDACFTKGQGSTRTLPETFVIERSDGGPVFLIALDVDEWEHHDIKQVGGLIA